MKTSNIKKSPMEKAKHRLLSLVASLLYVLSAGHPVLADDTEVLIGLGQQANVLFIMDTSGSMDGTVPNTNGQSRLDVVKDVFADLMMNPDYLGFNIALMRFNGAVNGGYFVSPMQVLNAANQSSIIAAANGLTAGNNTPLAETFYEAALFWGGLGVNYGTGLNVTGVPSSGSYTSPITSQCQKNFTILLTDGVPTSDDNADSDIQNLPGYSSGACAYDDNNQGTSGGSCLDEVADYLYTIDQNTTIADVQNVETFTIGFTTNQQLLEATALAGGGTALNGGGNDHYFTASNAAELTTAFTEALGAGVVDNGNFSPPALAANAFNGISHFNKLYFALFKPDLAPKWSGNVKPYALNSNNQLVGADGNVAVDANGAFTNNSRSFWSSAADAGDVVAGGANSRLPAAANRTLYTYTDNYSNAGVPDTSLSQFNDGNAGVTAGLLSPSVTITPAQRTAIITAARSLSFGAPLHSQPALVTYGGTDEASADLTLFVATNDGFLHALNASPSVENSAAGGRERFAFIPKELLGNLATLDSGAGSTVYGLDGDISVWVKESNDADKVIESGEGDHVFVYVGMRRGGNNYYALDATDRDAPVLKWVIKGGPVLSGGTPGFEELGQSWSKPSLTTIKYGGGTRKVLIFGGGYDTRQDANPINNTPNDTDTVGRAIFIVDADTGEKLWQGGNAEFIPDLVIPTMTHSIPSEVRLLDSDLDGNTDRLYVGGMRGQIFRIDLQATATGVSGTSVVLASLGGITEADNRRFYYPPDVVVTQRRGTPSYVSVNIGSGYRAHPLNPVNTDGTDAPRVNDRFYSLRDPNVLGAAPNGFTPLAGLLDVTAIPVLPAGTTPTTGWYITLGDSNGEKVLASSLTVNGEIFFTTYTPPAQGNGNGCAPPSGSGRLYSVSLFDGSPVLDQNGDSDSDDVADRVKLLTRPGIPSTPTPIFRPALTVCTGTQCDPIPNGIQIQESYWLSGN